MLLIQSMVTVEPTMTVLSIACEEIDSGRIAKTTRRQNKDNIVAELLRHRITDLALIGARTVFLTLTRLWRETNM